jgi:hypothetical protein
MQEIMIRSLPDCRLGVPVASDALMLHWDFEIIYFCVYNILMYFIKSKNKNSTKTPPF